MKSKRTIIAIFAIGLIASTGFAFGYIGETIRFLAAVGAMFSIFLFFEWQKKKDIQFIQEQVDFMKKIIPLADDNGKIDLKDPSKKELFTKAFDEFKAK